MQGKPKVQTLLGMFLNMNFKQEIFNRLEPTRDIFIWEYADKRFFPSKTGACKSF